MGVTLRLSCVAIANGKIRHAWPSNSRRAFEDCPACCNFSELLRVKAAASGFHSTTAHAIASLGALQSGFEAIERPIVNIRTRSDRSDPRRADVEDDDDDSGPNGN